MGNQQKESTQLVAQAGKLLLAHGAESVLVGSVMKRIGLACKMDEVEVSLSASSLIVTTIYQGHYITTALRCPEQGVNMRVIVEIQRICIMLERGLIHNTTALNKLNKISTERYNRWLIVVMMGLSCGTFSHLSGGDWSIFIITFVASSVGMFVRQEIHSRNFNSLLNVTVTAFIITMISSQAVVYGLGNTPDIAIYSAVLLLVPGVPLINSISDVLKGYINMGIARFVMASLLCFGTCLGMIASMSLFNIL